MSIQLTQIQHAPRIQHAPKIQHAPNLLGGISFVPFLTRFLADSAGCVSQLADQYGNDTAVAVATPFNLSQRKYVVGIGARQNQMVLGHKTAFRTTGYMFNGPPGSAMSRIRNGLLHSRGKEHSDIRSMLQPFFQTSRSRNRLANSFESPGSKPTRGNREPKSNCGRRCAC